MSLEHRNRIYQAVAGIPAGTVSSYGAIARAAGLPGRARAVGKALSETPAGVELPWHRVVRADGRIAFPSGSENFDRQCALLRAEGVTVRRGRVDMKRHGRQNLDRVLWGPDRPAD